MWLTLSPLSLLRAYPALLLAITRVLFLLSVVPLRAVDVMAASPGDIGVLFSTVSAVAIVGAPLGGYLADFGRRTAVVPAASLTVLGAAAVPFAADGAQFYAAMIAWGLGASLMTPALAAISQ